MQFSPEYFVFKMKTQHDIQHRWRRRRKTQTTQWSLYEFIFPSFILQLTIGYCRCVVCVTFMTTNECKNVCKIQRKSRESKQTKRFVWYVFCIFKEKSKKENELSNWTKEINCANLARGLKWIINKKFNRKSSNKNCAQFELISLLRHKRINKF